MGAAHRLINKLAISNTRVFTGTGTITMGAEGVLVVKKASGAATAVTLPSGPRAGDHVVIKDGKGDAGTNAITITPASGTIDGVASYVLRQPYGAVLLEYNGTEWAKVVAPSMAYVQIAAGTAHTATTDEALIGSYSIPANRLKAGTVVRVRYQGIATATNSTDTLTVKLYLGGLAGTALLAGTATDVANNNIFAGEALITIRTDGASGTFVAVGTHTEVPAASGTAVHDITEITASTAIDTTVAQVLGVGADWSTNNAGNSCRLDILAVEIL